MLKQLKLGNAAHLLIQNIQQDLISVGTLEKAEQMNKYMKQAYQHRGVQIPQVKEVFENYKKQLSSFSSQEKKDIACFLMQEQYGEDKNISCMIWDAIHKDVTLNDIQLIDELFDQNHLSSWATTDGLCCHFLKKWCQLKIENREYIANWCNSENIWKKRASCVTFVTLARFGDASPPNYSGFLELLYNTIKQAILCNHRFVQLGAGWLLREMTLANKLKTINFIEDNLKYFSKEGMRYATEKLSKSEQQRLISLTMKRKVPDNSNSDLCIQKNTKRKKPNK